MNDTNLSQSCDIDDNDGVFRKGSVMFYKHESGRVFSVDSTDVGDLMDDEAINEEMTGLPHGVVAYEPDPDSIEGQAMDRWTERIDEHLRQEHASSGRGGGGSVVTMSSKLRNAATATTIAQGGL